MTNKSNTQALANRIEALATHESVYLSADDVIDLKSAAAMLRAAQPTPEPVAQAVTYAAFERYKDLAIPASAPGLPAHTRSMSLLSVSATYRHQAIEYAEEYALKAMAQAPSPVALQGRDERWKVGNEFAPFHKSASHINPDYRDGWNACYEAARASLPAGGVVELIGFIPDYELRRLQSGHDASVRSAKFGPSELDGDVPIYATPQPSETQGRRQMTEDEIKAAIKACEPEDHTKEGWIWRARIKWARAIEAHHGIPSSPQDGGGQA